MILPIAAALALHASPMSCLLPHELAHAGGWGASHPGAIYTAACGHLPMPPHKFPLNGRKVNIHFIPESEMLWHCGPGAQACSDVGGDAPNVWLPRR